MKWMVLLLVPLVVVGCALTAEERQAIVDEAARGAGDQAAAVAHKRAIEAGLTEADAKKLAESARSEAEKGAAALASKAISEAEEKKRGNLGGAIASVLLALVQLASAGLKRGAA